MAEQTTTAKETTTVKETKPTAAVKTTATQYTGMTLKGEDGSRLEIYVRREPGGARAGCDHSTPNGDGKRAHTRGATSMHPSWEAGLQQQQKLIELAIKAGWTKPTGPSRAPKPDAFDAAHLPAPKAAVKK